MSLKSSAYKTDRTFLEQYLVVYLESRRREKSKKSTYTTQVCREHMHRFAAGHVHRFAAG